MFIFLVAIAAVSATDISVTSNTEDSNLTLDNVNALSQEKLEVSNEDSISETNIVNSHDDNLNDYPEEGAVSNGKLSYYEDNGEQKLGLANEVDVSLSASNEEDVVSANYADNEILSASKVATSLSVSDTHYGKSATYFKVTLQDSNGKTLSGQKVTLKVNSKSYTGTTDSKGIANIKTAALAVGTYTASLSYDGDSNNSASSLSKKVKVLSSVSGKDITKYYGTSTYYSATFYKDNAALAYTNVTFTVNGKKYTTTTNKNGVAKFRANLNPGKYVVTATNPYSGESIKNNLVVNKDKTSITANSKTYILPYNYYTYFVTLTSAHGTPVKNAKVTFSYANKTVTAKTNANGKASTVIPLLSKGTYKITYTFKGTKGYSASSATGTIYIKSASNKLTASDLKMQYKDGSKFAVTFTDNNNKVLSGKTITFKLNGKDYSAKTNSKGIAKLAVGDLKPGTYKIKYLYSTLGKSDYNYGYKNITISKLAAKLTAKNLVMKYNDGSEYKVTVKDNSGNVLKNVAVKFTVNGKSYSARTDSKGIAKLKITLPVGSYSIKSAISSLYYTASATKNILVNGSKFSASDLYVSSGDTVYYSVKLTDAKNKAIKSASVKFTIDGKTYTKKTNSTGVAKVKLGVLSAGNHKIKYSNDGASGTSKIHVIDKVTLNQVISASKTVKSYVEKNKKLPSSVTIGKIKYTTAEYLYLASKAIVNLKSNVKSDIAIKSVKNPSKPGVAEDMENLNDYLSVAKNVIKTADSKGQMPNSVSSSVGSIGYKGLVYAFARVVAFYGTEDVMPNYVAIKSLTSSSSVSSSKLNSKNTITNLKAYLAASTNCQVNNSKIKSLVEKLTKGLTSEKDKATAIYNYVRDSVSYSFYYNTRHGAVGTLNVKSGNCVDQAHLLVAMYRTAGLAARYAHGTCTFSSGTYGHVWTQVLIGDTWVVGDATSTRNSFGNVVNWNSNSYSLHGYYSSIAF